MNHLLPRLISRLPTTTFVLMLAVLSSLPAAAQELTPDLYDGLRWRHIGPPGNRASAVVGVPGDPAVSFIGGASGGVWKTTDGGNNWYPTFDDMEAQSIGAMAIAPSDPNIVWVGTGEVWVRSNISIGNGVYKSTDGGETWNHMGLDLTGRIGRVVIDPRDPNIVHVAAVGHSYGPQQERGIFRTTDGGETWEQTLFIDENTGVFEIAIDPSNPRTLLAGAWPLVIRTYGRESGGPNGGIYRSTDSGETWEKLSGHGLPDDPVGKIGIAYANSDPDVVYAMIETGWPNRGVLWRSSDGGENWTLVSSDRLLNERSHYAGRILVNPADENEIYFNANSHSISYDGGYTTERSGWGGDTHDMWADPLMPDRMMISDDGGANLTYNRGETWERVTPAIAQMYHVNVDNQIPYFVYGGKQDGSGYKGPSTVRARGWGVSTDDWESSAGCESGFIVPDPVIPEIVWGGCYTGGFTKVDYRTGHQRSVKVWPESSYGAAAKDVKYRINWTFPITISPHDHNKVYFGSQYVHQTTDGGESWQIISPDLSGNDPSLMGPSGGLTKDNIGVEMAQLVFAIAESPLEEGVIWAGTNDGFVHITRDGGENWTNLTANVPNLPPWGTVSNIHPSKHHAGTAYMSVDFHQMNGRDPYVYKTTDYGQSWVSIASDLPVSVFSYVHWVHEDPVRQGLLYLGTENAIYMSFNDGGNWLTLQNNLPHAPVHDVVVQEHFNDLVIATYGRGFWILDDVTPFQQLTDDVLASGAHLFAPRQTYRMHSITGGAPVPTNAFINYYLKEAPAGPVELEILDSRGQLVNTLRGSRDVGINRISWNMRYPGPEQAKIRTKPPGNPTVVQEKRFREQWEEEGWIPVLSWGTQGGFSGVRVAPGIYTVNLKVGGETFTQELEILKDPRSDGTLANIQEMVAMQLQVRDDITAISGMVNEIEWMKKQLNDLFEALGGGSAAAARAAGKELYGQVQELEDKILQPYAVEGDSKSFRFPNMLYSKMSVLGGDLAESVDFAPNQQQQEVYELLRSQMTEYGNELRALVAGDVAAFNRMLAEQNMAGVISAPGGG